MRRALIDTGAVYAFVDRKDAHHAEAVAFTRTWLAAHGGFLLLDVVFAETMTLLKVRVGTEVALRVGREIRENPTYVWHALGPDGERDTWASFQRYADKDWSYVDCALLVMSSRLRVPRIFAFDRHFTQMPGVVRVPS